MTSGASLAPGDVFAGCRVKARLASGGIGEVYSAVWPETRLEVAIKVLRPELAEDAVIRDGFLRAARRLIPLSHAHILPIYETGIENGMPYLVMGYRPSWFGLNRALAERGSLPPLESVVLIEHVAAALDDAWWMAGLVHADLKPSNILLTDDCLPHLWAYVIDFLGLVAQRAHEQPPGLVVGTPPYMAPEVARGEAPSRAADVWALGCVFYECLTGQNAFADLAYFAAADVPRPSDSDPELAPFDRLVSRALEHSPTDRFATCDDLARAARTALETIFTACEQNAPVDALQPYAIGVPAPGAFAQSPMDVPEQALSYGAPSPPPPSPASPDAQDQRSEESPGSTDTQSRRAEAWFDEAARSPARTDPAQASGPSGSPGQEVLRLPVVRTTPLELDETVDCSVFAPMNVSAGQPFLVQALAHLPEQAADAAALAAEFEQDAKRRAVRTLQMPIRRGAMLMFELTLGRLEVANPIESLRWQGHAEAVQFEVHNPADTAPGKVIGTLGISHDGVPVGHLKFTLEVLERDATWGAPDYPLGDDAHHYGRAFLSYSSLDRVKVLERAQLLRAVGIDCFQDVDDLKPGDRWWDEIANCIRTCDLFLLFWSDAARSSEWVRRELKEALARKGTDDFAPPEIKPVILEGPPVPPPWPEVAHLHFNDRLLYIRAGT
jgi:serine/threonine-protein kinase